MGETSGVNTVLRPPLAHTARKGAVHVGTKLRRIMARGVAEPNGFWRSLAIGAMGLIIMMLGAFLAYQVAKTDGIEDSVNEIKTDIALIQQRLGIDDGR